MAAASPGTTLVDVDALLPQLSASERVFAVRELTKVYQAMTRAAA